MNEDSGETKALRDGLGSTPYLTELIDATIMRFTREGKTVQTFVKLQFPDELEDLYEVQTKHDRVRELQITVSASILLMILVAVTDGTFMPDMGLRGLYIRLIPSAILGAAVVSFQRFSGEKRELLLCVVAYMSVFTLALVPLLSRAQQAPYGLFVWIFALIYCNTTTPLRFRCALPFSVLCVGSNAVIMPLSGRVGAGLSDALTFLAVIGATFSLIANYRMEKSVRLSYLLASKEELRLAVLNRNYDQLMTVSNTDALTGLSNRGYFDRRVDALFASSFDLRTKIGLILIDVDYFKRYNDRYGHPAGDACLRAIANIIVQVVRGKNGFGFRYGGEEFGVLLLDSSSATSESIAESIRVSVERQGIEHLGRGDNLGAVTVSVGVGSVTLGDGGTAKELIANADASLYRAKENGRNRTVFRSRNDSAA